MGPVQQQLDAYNARNVDRFVASYGPNAVIEDGEGAVLVQGHDGIRALYQTLFAQSPDLRCDVSTRIQVGKYEIQDQRITGVRMEGLPEQLHAAVVYSVDGDQITRVRIFW